MARRGAWSVDNDTAAAVAITVPAVADMAIVIDNILFSYDSDPSAGAVTISDGTNEPTIDIVNGGGRHLPLDYPFIAQEETAVTVTPASGGDGVTGKLNVHYYYV